MVKVEPPLQYLLQRQIASLPFDVLIRRIHSSSKVNPARSLETHFLGDVSSQKGLGSPVIGTASSSTTMVDRMAAASPSELRLFLSERLLHDVRQYPGGEQLGFDDLSLIVVNALRHRLSPELVGLSLRHFVDSMVVAAGENQVSMGIEALSRVMEVCCDAELEEGSPLTWDGLASIVAVVEQRWFHLVDTLPTCILLLQFLSAAVAAQLPEKATSSGLLKTDPRLLRERCLELADSATDALAQALGSGRYPAWGPKQLHGMCTVVGQLGNYEKFKASAPHNSVKRLTFWKCQRTWSERTQIWKKIRRILTTQILAHNSLEKTVSLLPLQQAAELFVSVSSACGNDAVSKISAPVHQVLKKTVVGDVRCMENIIGLGEASLLVEGASALLAQSIDSISRYAYVLISGNEWGFVSRACALLERAPLSMLPQVQYGLSVLQLIVQTAKCTPCDAPEFSAYALAVASLAALLTERKLSTTVEFWRKVIAIAEGLPLLRNSAFVPSIVLRCLFFLLSAVPKGSSGEVGAVGECTRALTLLTTEAKKLQGKEGLGANGFHLTVMERRTLRFVLSQSGTLVTGGRDNHFED